MPEEQESVPPVHLYRAVQPAERADIEERNAFHNIAGCEVKYFARSIAEAQTYGDNAQTSYGDGPYSLVRTNISAEILAGLALIPIEFGIQTVVVTTAQLAQLGPPEFFPPAPHI